MSKKNRRHFSAEEKVMILKKCLIGNIPVSDVCDEYNIHPTVFYRWQKQFFENGSKAFEKGILQRPLFNILYFSKSLNFNKKG